LGLAYRAILAKNRRRTSSTCLVRSSSRPSRWFKSVSLQRNRCRRKNSASRPRTC
jgi:hypothetical protein